MLVLQRRVGETVIVGEDEVRITVLNTRRGVVSLGFSADVSIPIQREEIYDRIIEERIVDKLGEP